MNQSEIIALRERARSGDLHALTTLGTRLLMGRALPRRPGRAWRASRMPRPAATARRWRSSLCSRPARCSRSIAARCRARWAPAQRELQFLAHVNDTDWPGLRRLVNVAAWTTPPPARVVSEAPRIRVIEGFATAAECDWLVGLARHGLRRAMIYRKDAVGHTEADTRTNTEADYTIGNADIVLSLVIDRIAAAAGVATRFFEVAKLLRYEPGQHFSPHCDFQEPVTPALASEVERHGQRVATALVYLNDDYEGGETDFPRIGFRYKGARGGDALLFFNVAPSGALDYDTLHAGLPRTSGVKWVLSQWIRGRPVSTG